MVLHKNNVSFLLVGPCLNPLVVGSPVILAAHTYPRCLVGTPWVLGKGEGRNVYLSIKRRNKSTRHFDR